MQSWYDVRWSDFWTGQQQKKVLWIVWGALLSPHLIEQASNLELVGSRFDHRVQCLCICNPRHHGQPSHRKVWYGMQPCLTWQSAAVRVLRRLRRRPTFAADAHVGDAGGEVAEQPNAAAGDAVDAGGVFI
jgi:hypothetical protein